MFIKLKVKIVFTTRSRIWYDASSIPFSITHKTCVQIFFLRNSSKQHASIFLHLKFLMIMDNATMNYEVSCHVMLYNSAFIIMMMSFYMLGSAHFSDFYILKQKHRELNFENTTHKNFFTGHYYCCYETENMSGIYNHRNNIFLS